MCDAVYEQWLHTDINDSTLGTIPEPLIQRQGGVLEGRYIVQVCSYGRSLRTKDVIDQFSY